MALYFMEWKEDLGRTVLGVMIPHSISSLTTDLLGPAQHLSVNALDTPDKKKETKNIS